MPIYIRLTIVLAALTMLMGCSKLTMENYTKIKMGNEYGEGHSWQTG